MKLIQRIRENCKFLNIAHHQNGIIYFVQHGFVSHAGINYIYLLLPHIIFNLTSKGKVFWQQYIFSPVLGHVILPKWVVAIMVNEIYFLSKFG